MKGKCLRWCQLLGIALAGLLTNATALAQGQDNANPAGRSPGSNMTDRVYTLSKKVSDYLTSEDLSTPEAAYATCARACASGEQAAWRRLSVKRLAEQMPRDAKKTEVPASAAKEWLSAEIVEVHVFHDRMAMVFARIPHAWKNIIDIRTFDLEDGVWRNAGNDVVGSLAEAQKLFARRCAWRLAEMKRKQRPPIPNPEEHLARFVEFLRHEAAEPQKFLLHSLADHRVVVLGEVHNRPRYWAFNTALVRSPEFARTVGVIYLEFPFNDQPLMDRFLAAPTNDPAPVIEMLRDLFEMGWPDQATVEFCQAVWKVNQSLPKERRLRIVLVDMARPWKEIQKREDWRKFETDRDELMAANIARDLRDHADDTRHALFIVGWMHARQNLTDPAGNPMKSAGWHLRKTLGNTNVFTVFPHGPVMSNRGSVDGRLALGLFESAFATLTNRPMAFPLDRGPFGELLFDASLDFTTGDPYRAGFDAFLYLGPLEDEIMSPLIPGFYTDEYAREVDRRCRLMNGRGLKADPQTRRGDGASLARMRGAYWGQPRYEWRALGPLNAWRYGSEWEKNLIEAKHREALKDAVAIQQAAKRLFDALRQVDYANPPRDPNQFPAPDVDYTVLSDYPGWMQWVCRQFQANPVVKVDLGEVFLASNRLPALNYKLTLKDGSKLEGTLPFRWNARAECWGGLEGLDWHRPKPQAGKP